VAADPPGRSVPAPPSRPPTGAPGAQPARAPWREPPSRARAALGVTFDFLRRTWDKAGADDIFFLAAAIAFNVLVAFVPLVLAALGMAGFILRHQANSTGTLMGLVLKALPSLNPGQELYVESMLQGLLEKSISFLSVGMVFLVWFATRLIGTLRSALKSVFDLAADRGIIAGKIFDIEMVFATGALFTLNVGLTIALEVIASLGMDVLGLQLANAGTFQRLYVEAVAFLSIWVMFLLIYRFLPARRTGWQVSIIAATFTSVLFEILKQLFSWYVIHMANYTSTYGNLATLVVLGLWIYYSAVIFILGGEVAQVWAMKRIRQQQKERLA